MQKYGGNTANLIVIEEVRNAVVKSVDAEQKKIYFEDKTVYGKEEKFIKLEDDCYTLKDMQNIDVDIKDIKQGYVVSVLMSGDKEYADITVTDEKIRVASAEADSDRLYVDGKEYLISDDFDRDEKHAFVGK
ncbi:MAG: hypothetical protein L6V93_21975 [Clostridiales bacterium]|nr:MAG: hypothetical protein L6V93_21975 [Clostridiales bacterium]